MAFIKRSKVQIQEDIFTLSPKVCCFCRQWAGYVYVDMIDDGNTLNMILSMLGLMHAHKHVRWKVFPSCYQDDWQHLFTQKDSVSAADTFVGYCVLQTIVIVFFLWSTFQGKENQLHTAATWTLSLDSNECRNIFTLKKSQENQKIRNPGTMPCVTNRQTPSWVLQKQPH